MSRDTKSKKIPAGRITFAKTFQKIHTDSVADNVFVTLDLCKNFSYQKRFIKVALTGQQHPSTFSPALKSLINFLRNGKLESHS